MPPPPLVLLPVSMVARKSFAEKLPSFLRTYKTEKFIRVDVPRVGIFFRVGQLLAFMMVLAQLYLNDGWAKGDAPGGISNAWTEPGGMLQQAITTPNLAELTGYCDNANYSYSSEIYAFSTPECETFMPAELTGRDASSVFYTTAILETVTKAWPCAATYAGDRETECAAVDGALFSYNGQCGCQSQRAVYPLKVEEMLLAFEHTFDSTVHGISGSSAAISCSEMDTSLRQSMLSWVGMGDPECSADGEGLWSMVFFPNGTRHKFDAGEVLRLPVREWLAAANISLDHRNIRVKPDPQNGLPPMRRTTGLNIKVAIEYTNVDNVTKRAVPGKTAVHANVYLTAEAGTWTGADVETVWVQYPTLPRNVPQDYHLVERMKQGVQFTFTSYGLIVMFDFFFLLSVVLSGLVLLKFANTAANFYAFNCLGAESVVLRNKRIELTSKKSEFAEIGMKAALAAATYPNFDRYCDGTIEAEDIARAFARVDGVDWETAYMIARNILNDADTEPSLGGEVPGLNYVEFMTCLEGDSIDFDDFLADTRRMYDELIVDQAKEDAEDAAEAGKKPPPKPAGEMSLKQKLKAAKAKAKKIAEERKEKLALVEAKLKADAKAAGKSFDDYMEDKERKEDQELRERCRLAFEAEKAEIEKNRPADAAPRKKKEEAPAAGGGGGGEASGSGATPPVAGDDLGLSDEAKDERLGQAGTLKLQLQSASGLKAVDKGNSADPYVVAKLGKKSKQSKVIKQTLEPAWDETLEFVTKVSLKTVIKNGLVLELKDKDNGMLDSDDMMGTVNAVLSQLDSVATLSFNEEVLGGGGLIKFTVSWEPSGTATPKKEKSKKKADTPKTDGEAAAPAEAETTQNL